MKPSTWWRSWVEFTSEREDGATLALMRVLFGVIACVSMLETLAYGVLDVAFVGQAYGGAFDVSPNWLVTLLGGPTPRVVHGLAIAAAVGGLLVAAGVGGRLTPLLTLWFYRAVTQLNGQSSGGYDPLLTNALWLLFLGNAACAYSVDGLLRERARRSGERPWHRWVFGRDGQTLTIVRRLAVLQILVVYFSTGLQKMSPVWTPAGGYSALYWVFQEPTWRHVDLTWTAKVYPLTQIATAVTWHWELGAGLMFPYLWLRHTAERGGRLRRLAKRFDLRKPFLGTGIALHLGILMLLSVGPFSFVTVSFYPAFYRPDEVRAALRALARRSSGILGRWNDSRQAVGSPPKQP
ncbi:MAG: HTTM domain-containing protein [Polyangiaceae bacterium]